VGLWYFLLLFYNKKADVQGIWAVCFLCVEQ
jgi:hypothetical protein